MLGFGLRHQRGRSTVEGHRGCFLFTESRPSWGTEGGGFRWSVFGFGWRGRFAIETDEHGWRTWSKRFEGKRSSEQGSPAPPDVGLVKNRGEESLPSRQLGCGTLDVGRSPAPLRRSRRTLSRVLRLPPRSRLLQLAARAKVVFYTRGPGYQLDASPGRCLCEGGASPTQGATCTVRPSLRVEM